MKKFLLLSMILISGVFPNSYADEGMWLLSLIQSLNIDSMNALGCNLTADDIYNINKSSIKDAIVIFDGGCTGEIISEDGLLITNHHCGFDFIQSHSSVEHNYLEDGFWAMNREEELPNPDLTVTFLKSVEDVTDVILSRVENQVNESNRNDIIMAIADSLSSNATSSPYEYASVEPLFGGNSYFLFVYKVYEDVRLVGTPPSSIGKFGSDSDNWMWPRHTGDFSIFRVYTDPEGNPAPYHAENIPLKPDYYLSISLKGYQNGDFSMVLGYPGGTDRYMTSYEIKEVMEITNPNRIKIRGLRQDILWEEMMADEKTYIQYASKYFGSTNYYKFSIGQNEGLKRLKLLENKQKEEDLFTKWTNQNEQRQEQYGTALELIRQSIEQRAPYESALQYTYESFFSATEMINFAYTSSILYHALVTEPNDKPLIDSLANVFRLSGNGFYKDYDVNLDMKVTPSILKLFYENVPAEYHPSFYQTIQKKYKNDCEKFSNMLFKKSIFASQDKFNEFLDQPKASILENDPAFQTAQSALAMYRDLYYALMNYDEGYEKGHRLYIKGLMEMYEDKVFYPDANFTMRLTYGTVSDYDPRDAVHYNYYTTLKGVMEKEDPSNVEFMVADKLKKLYETKAYKHYGQDGIMPVCFITNNDITGGNSGSPVLDADGNLIGLAFDGNWEAMTGDIFYEDALQRCICVDIRYVLFVIDQYANASHLIDEMKLVQ